MGESLYERIGGEPAVMAAVDLFYRKVVADEVTRHFFEHLDMTAQVKKQVAFMTWAFGGPVEYRGRPLRAAHKQLVEERGLNGSHFAAVIAHLDATLREMGIAEDLIREAIAIVRGVEDEVLNRG